LDERFNSMPGASPPALPAGLRLYAIGDIHGSLDKLQLVLDKIEKDTAGFPGTVRKIFLGDYVDRGLYSKQTVDFLIDWSAKQKEPPIFLLGNHEQVMRSLLSDPDENLMQDWFTFGGRETLMSYGVNPSGTANGAGAILAAMKEKVPKSHLEFLSRLQTSITSGDYFFCHAGARPGIDLAQQSEEDLIWIRYEFLNHKNSFGKVIVHGHTISNEVEFMPNRIGIDTGAYATGCLTALGLEGTRQWLIQSV